MSRCMDFCRSADVSTAAVVRLRRDASQFAKFANRKNIARHHELRSGPGIEDLARARRKVQPGRRMLPTSRRGVIVWCGVSEDHDPHQGTEKHRKEGLLYDSLLVEGRATE